MAKKKPERNYLTPRPGKSLHNFGRSAAEFDADLLEYYVNPERYVARAINIEDPAVFFVGPKGVGKSAILQMVKLLRERDAARVIKISPDDLAFSALANVSASTPIMSEAEKNQWLFKALWDYILALEVLRREHKDRNAFTTALSAIIRTFFGSRHEKEANQLLAISLGDEGQQHTLSSRILQLVKEVELSAEVQLGVKVGGKATLDDGKGERPQQLWLLSLIHSVAKGISDHLKAPYHILIDDLDLHWHDTPVQNAFIAALFFSLRNFSKPPNLKCVVAIRDEIFRRLPLEDRDKYHDWVCHVEWEAPNVKKMMERRIVSRMDIQAKDIWGGLFPENAITKMMHHSYGRPREALRIVTLSVDQAQKNNHRLVEESDLDTAIDKFSDGRITEIAAEYNYRYRGLDPIIRRFKEWPKEFKVAKLKELIDELWLDIECEEESARDFTWAGGFVDNVVGFGRILLECGILLYKAHERAQPVTYDVDSRQGVTAETWVAIHPVFWRALLIPD
jgi:hypothetical protein